MSSVTLDENALESLVKLVTVKNRLASALVSAPHSMGNRIAEARETYSAGIEQSLAPYRSISVIDQVIREYESLANMSDKAIISTFGEICLTDSNH